MAKLKTQYRVIIWCMIFIVYAFFAARHVGKETVLTSKWLYSLETNYPSVQNEGDFFPFQLGERFGYISEDGRFTINQQKKGNVLLSPALWAEFSGEAETIDIKNQLNETVLTLRNPGGYPFFLDNNIYIMHSEQNAITRLNKDGSVLWRYDFASTITCVDAAAGYLLAGLLDGAIELINPEGGQEFFSKPSGSRLDAIYGCALSRNAEKIAIISGKDDQRFVLIEQLGASRRISSHEFLGDGFNRPVRIKFINGEQYIVFEREDGIGIFDIERRISRVVPVSGRVLTIEHDGTDDLIFIITEEAGEQKRLVVLHVSGRILVNAPFKSRWSFLERRAGQVIIGGGNMLAAFNIEIK